MRAVYSLIQLAGLVAIVYAAYLIEPALLIGIGGFAAVGIGNALERRRETLNDDSR